MRIVEKLKGVYYYGKDKKKSFDVVGFRDLLCLLCLDHFIFIYPKQKTKVV